MELKNNPLTETKEEEKPPPPVRNLATKGSFFVPQNEPLLLYPYCFQDTLTPKQKNYYHTNGHASLLKSLQVKIVSQIDECRQLWNKFSPRLSLFDTWEFRFAFWKGYQYTPFFITLKSGSEDYALLPLWYEEDKKRYTWFGSAWQEENRFLVKDPLFIPLMLAICPSPTLLNAISTELPLWVEKVIKLKRDDSKYVLNLNNIHSTDDYLATLKKKKRYNLKRDKRIIEAQEPRIIFDNFSDFDTLVNLSVKRCQEKGEDASWKDPRRVKTFRQIIKLVQIDKTYQVRMLTVMIGNKAAAVDLITLFNDCYYALVGANDVKNFPGIGNYITFREIGNAISLGMKKMDFLKENCNWKDKWFEEVSLFKYEKK